MGSIVSTKSITKMPARYLKKMCIRDRYGRKVPKHAHGTVNLGEWTSSGKTVTEAVVGLYDRITDKGLLVRRVTLSANHVLDEDCVVREQTFEQLTLFTDYEALEKAVYCMLRSRTVSYTHLDVYKRQDVDPLPPRPEIQMLRRTVPARRPGVTGVDM